MQQTVGEKSGLDKDAYTPRCIHQLCSVVSVLPAFLTEFCSETLKMVVTARLAIEDPAVVFAVRRRIEKSACLVVATKGEDGTERNNAGAAISCVAVETW